MKRLVALLLVCVFGLTVLAQETVEVAEPNPWDYFLGEWRSEPTGTYTHIFKIEFSASGTLVNGWWKPALILTWTREDDDPFFPTVIPFGNAPITLFQSQGGDLKYGLAVLEASDNNHFISHVLVERISQGTSIDGAVVDALKVRVLMSLNEQIDFSSESHVVDMTLTRYVPEPEEG